MTHSSVRAAALLSSLILPALGSGTILAAESAQTSTTRSPTTSAARPPAARTTTTRGVLPDPALLDGSTQKAEKKSDYGMIGDFELPGDENAKTGRVGGGQQNPGEQQQQQQGGGGALPTGGGGAQAQAQQGGQPPGAQQAGQSQAGGGPQDENAKQGGPAGAGDPNAKAEGMKVAQIGGEPSGDQPQGAAGGKPPPVAIGDSAMRIQTTPNTPGVVGQQQVATNTQVYEKGTGSGGKGPSAPGGTNRAEKGRTIPSGL